MKQLPMKQQGFTLLELLVVITLLAVLSVGALVAYEGVGENAQATAQANNTVTTDKAIRNYRAVTGGYPNQWDSLSVDATGAAIPTLADDTAEFFGNFNIAAASAAGVTEILEDVGIEELQTVSAQNGVAPNLMHNEGSNPTGAAELEIDDVTNVSIIPAGAGCTVAGVSISDNYEGETPALADASQALNKINDSLELDRCHLVVALGFGHDAAHSTFNSSVAVSSAPTFTGKEINPSVNYARYVALFHIGSKTTAGAGDIDSFNANARLLAVVSPDGKAIDEALAVATAAN